MKSVYFIREAGTLGPIKIGVARDPIKRLGTLQGSSARPLEIAAVVAGDFALEKSIHRSFESARIVREWFEATPRLLALVERLAGGGQLLPSDLADCDAGGRGLTSLAPDRPAAHNDLRARLTGFDGVLIAPAAKRKGNGMRLANWLDLRKLTATDLARGLGTSTSTVTRIIKGEAFPSPILAHAIRVYTHGAVSADDLLDAWHERKTEIGLPDS